MQTRLSFAAIGRDAGAAGDTVVLPAICIEKKIPPPRVP